MAEKKVKKELKKPKKVTAKKAVKKTAKSAAKKLPAKKITSKQAVKKAPVKKVTKNTSKKDDPKKVANNTVPEPKTEVNLPSNASVRMIEKAGVLQIELDNYIKECAFRVAYVAGICFMLVGASYAASQAHTKSLTIKSYQQAQIISTEPTEGEKVFEAIETDSEEPTKLEGAEAEASVEQSKEVPPPVFEIITQAPKQTDNHFSFVYSATNISSTKLEVRYVDASKQMPSIPLENKSGDKYRAEIPADTYREGLYRIVVYITPLDTGIGTRAYSQEFYVEGTIDIIEPAPGGSTEPEDPVETESEVTTPKEEVASEETTSNEDQMIEEPAEPEVVTLSDTEVAGEIIGDDFEIRIPDNEITGSVRIEVRKPDSFSTPELYARPTNSLSSKYITSAVIRNDKLVFAFDSGSFLPNGKYELYSITKRSEKTLTSNSLFVSVSNPSTTAYVEPIKTTDPVATNEPQPYTSPNEAPTLETAPYQTEPYAVPEPIKTAPEEREFIRVENPETTTSTRKIAPEVEDDFEKTIERNTEDLNTILKRYAAAQQAGDEALIKAAKGELDAKRREIVSETLRDERMRDYADDIDKELEVEFETLQRKVETFEKLRKDKSEGASAKDTDQDGISDFDEISIFNTDPNSPDSDNDGFNDGVEIVRGFNPTDDSPEAVVVFKSPKESKLLTREDVLSVDEIIPITDVKNASSTTAPVTSEIRGKGLPNSYLTLFIFSQPTVVTVKTDADGSFVYTFDKELEDGEHEVYVAVTDNTGDIIAQSNAFSFIKRAQAFTPVDTATDDLISSETIIESSSGTYGVVAGMGLLALGLILVMLGVSLRSKKEEAIVTDAPGEGNYKQNNES